MNLYTIRTPFGLLSPEVQKELKACNSVEVFNGKKWNEYHGSFFIETLTYRRAKKKAWLPNTSLTKAEIIDGLCKDEVEVFISEREKRNHILIALDTFSIFLYSDNTYKVEELAKC